jgi:hypothetical protein
LLLQIIIANMILQAPHQAASELEKDVISHTHMRSFEQSGDNKQLPIDDDNDHSSLNDDEREALKEVEKNWAAVPDGDDVDDSSSSSSLHQFC